MELSSGGNTLCIILSWIFTATSLRLVIEVDGSIHDLLEQAEYDQFRSALINQHNIKVIRFSNNEILFELDKVIETIRQHILTRP